MGELFFYISTHGFEAEASESRLGPLDTHFEGDPEVFEVDSNVGSFLGINWPTRHV